MRRFVILHVLLGQEQRHPVLLNFRNPVPDVHGERERLFRDVRLEIRATNVEIHLILLQHVI